MRGISVPAKNARQSIKKRNNSMGVGSTVWELETKSKPSKMIFF
jgi:hypothetical protein